MGGRAITWVESQLHGASLRFQRWLDEAGYEGREAQRVAATLRAIGLTFFGGISIILLASWIVLTPPNFAALSIMCGALVLILVSLVLLRHGRPRVAALVLVGMTWIASTAGLVFGGGLDAPSYSFYTVSIAAAGLLLGGRWAVGMAALCLASGALVYALGSVGALPEQRFFYQRDASYWWVEGVLFLSMAALVFVSLTRLRRAFDEAEHSEAALAERNRELVVSLEARDEAERGRDLLHRAMDQAGEAIVVVDDGNQVIYANSAFESMSGLTTAEMAGLDAQQAFGAYDEAERREILRTLDRGESWRGRFSPQPPADPGLVLEGSIAPVTNGDARATGFVAVVRDITRETELEAQLNQSQKMEALGRLAGGVAHDFNNLLVVIQGYARMLRDEAESEPEQAEAAGRIQEAAQRAADLTGKLLAFGRRQVVRERVINLNDVVDDAIDMLARLLPENIEVETDLAYDLWNVRADPGQMQQVLLNLVANARDAMPDGGSLTLRTRNVEAHSPESVALLVSDTGHGMEASTTEHIFEPFFTTRGVNEGTGLGLASVFGIVEGCGGTIDVESRLDVGTTFYIALPRTKDPLEAPPVTALPCAALRGQGRVMVVEDQEAVRRLISRVLERAGFDVEEAVDGEDALARLGKNGVELEALVTDVLMPRMDGPALASRLRERWPDVAVIYTSGYSPNELIAEAKSDRDAVFLPKPFEHEQLIATLVTLLERRAERRAGA